MLLSDRIFSKKVTKQSCSRLVVLIVIKEDNFLKYLFLNVNRILFSQILIRFIFHCHSQYNTIWTIFNVFLLQTQHYNPLFSYEYILIHSEIINYKKVDWINLFVFSRNINDTKVHYLWRTYHILYVIK